MKCTIIFALKFTLIVALAGAFTIEAKPSKVDTLLTKENTKAKQPLKQAEQIDDLTFLRRVSIDIIGRIPTRAEIEQFQKWPAAERRAKVIDTLLVDPRFADRWTVFLSDILRIRSNATGGNSLLAYIHKALEQNRPWDQLAREMISANGTTGNAPAVGFILGENTDPMALAAATAQMFLGVRMQCAQCHNHPFDVWKQKQFYELATYFGKTRRVENQFSRRVYTTEADATTVLWPPERRKPKVRKPVLPKFPIELDEYASVPGFIKRFEAGRSRLQVAAADGQKLKSIDELLASVNPNKAFDPEKGFGRDVTEEVRAAARALDVKGDLYRQSKDRASLAKLITSPYNRYFARNMVNRMWAELIGRGFYEPIDDFQDIVVHPETLNYLCDEFVASGYDLKALMKMIVSSKVYSLEHPDSAQPEAQRLEAEKHFTAAPTRRMVSEALYDSVVIAGHLSNFKWPAGANIRTYTERVRVADGVVEGGGPAPAANADPAMDPNMMAMPARGGYSLEAQIALNFDDLLKSELRKDLAMMKQMADTDLEAEKRRREEAANRPTPTGLRMKYKYIQVERKVDDNPRFGSTMRMATPAPPAHFLRVFGQPGRESLGEFRDNTPSMRQQLMMLNGKAIHEASRVGPMEPMWKYLGGGKQNIDKAIDLAYLEIFTRLPSADERKMAREIIGTGKPALDGMADLRWALLNSNEFRYLP
jgi:hypothetical protein